MVESASTICCKAGGSRLVVKPFIWIDGNIDPIIKRGIVLDMIVIQLLVCPDIRSFDIGSHRNIRIDSYIGIAVCVIGVEIHHIIRIAGQYELHIGGIIHRYGIGAGIDGNSTGAVDTRHNLHGPLHIVVGNPALKTDSVLQAYFRPESLGSHKPEREILRTSIGSKAPHHHTVGIRHKIAALIVHTGNRKLHHGQRTVKIEYAFIICHSRLVDTCRHISLAHHRISAELTLLVAYISSISGTHQRSGR